MATVCLYRRLLGDRFAELPGVLQCFHDAAGGSGAKRGDISGLSAARASSALVATLLRLPAAGARVPVRLVVTPSGDREQWDRFFGGHRVRTLQWAHGEHVMEQFGIATFACALVIEGSRLRYEFKRAWLAGIAIPSWLSPRVISHVDTMQRAGGRSFAWLHPRWVRSFTMKGGSSPNDRLITNGHRARRLRSLRRANR